MQSAENKSSGTAQVRSVQLWFLGPDGRDKSYDLANDASMLVGADEDCRVQLKGDGIAARHCMFRFTDGVLTVQDWFSQTGTRVNGDEITSETVLSSDDRVSIGAHEIRVEIKSIAALPCTEGTIENAGTNSSPKFDSAEDGAKATSWADTGDCDGELRPGHGLTEPAACAPWVRVSSAGRAPSELNDLQRQLSEAHATIDQLLAQIDQNAPASLDSPYARTGNDGQGDDVLQQLEAENQLLRNELADKETQLGELLHAIDSGSSLASFSESADVGHARLSVSDDPFCSETERLVQRLEQLLDELSGSDHRIRTLEQMLQTSDEATQAEQQERLHLAQWLDEVELRIGQREEEWHLEREHLQRQLAQTTAQREKVSAAAQARGGRENDQALQEAEAKSQFWKTQYDELKQQLQAAQSELKRFESLELAVDGQRIDAETMVRLYGEIRSKELGLSQERALVARQRAEMTRLQEQLEFQFARQEQTGGDEATQRLAALRAHLADIHENEKTQRGSRSLAGRIAQLWQRL